MHRLEEEHTHRTIVSEKKGERIVSIRELDSEEKILLREEIR